MFHIIYFHLQLIIHPLEFNTCPMISSPVTTFTDIGKVKQQPTIIYDPNTLYRTSGQQQPPPPSQIQPQQTLTSIQSNLHMNDALINQQKHQHQQSIPQQVLHLSSGMLTTDDNILKSLLQINPQAVSLLFIQINKSFYFFI
jgi:hypothetical protein